MAVNHLGYRREILSDRPTAFYWLAEDQASNLERDISGNGTSSVGVGSPSTPPGPGFSRRSKGFTSTSRFEISGGGISGLQDVLTLEVWVRRQATGTIQAIVGRGAAGFYVRWHSDNTIMLLKSGVALLCQSTRTVTDTERFHHIVGTKNGADNHIYLDGADVTGTVTNATCSTADTKLYVNNDPSDGMGTHHISAVAAYPAALSRDRVLAHYLAGVPNIGLPIGEAM